MDHGRDFALESDAVVLDAHVHLVGLGPDVDIRVLGARVTPHVGDALARDLQHVVDEIGRPDTLGAQRKARCGLPSALTGVTSSPASDRV